MDPYPQGKRFYSSARCKPARRPHRRLRWHCCPCNLPPIGTEEAKRNAQEVSGRQTSSPPDYGVSSLQTKSSPWEEPPSHLRVSLIDVDKQEVCHVWKVLHHPPENRQLAYKGGQVAEPKLTTNGRLGDSKSSRWHLLWVLPLMLQRLLMPATFTTLEFGAASPSFTWTKQFHIHTLIFLRTLGITWAMSHNA